MSPTSASIIPLAVADGLRTLGVRIARARIRRGLRQRDLAEKAGIALMTLVRVEHGHPTTSIGAYFAAIWAMGLEREFADLLAPERDEEGVTLELARAPRRVRLRAAALSDDF